MMATAVRSKVLALQELNSVLGGLAERGGRLALAHGVFDVLHPGHIAYLRYAKGFADTLVVSVTADEFVDKGPGKPVFALWQRMDQIAALEAVDYVVASHAVTAEQVIRTLQPDFFVKGGDYTVEQIAQAEQDAVRDIGGELTLTPYYPVPKNGLNDAFPVYSEATSRWLEGFRRRHGADEVFGALDSIKNMSVLIVGEYIEDRYVFVNTLTKSPREHHISVRRVEEETYEGGARAIQRHLTSFVASVDLTRQVEPIVKTRFVETDEKRKIFSVQDLPEDVHLTLEGISHLDRIGDYDLVIAMDYGHGLFRPELRCLVEKGARFLALNCQTNSANYGLNLATKWGRADFLCMDRPEYRLAVSNGFVLSRVGKAVITDGARGCNLGVDVPSFVTKLVDRVGAGDALFCITAPLVAKKVDGEVAAFIGSCAAAMQCETVGNERPIGSGELRKFIERLVA